MNLFDSMTEAGTGQTIYELRKQILNLSSELALLDFPLPRIPELINSANLVRSNEILMDVSSKKSEIISAYEKYSKELESMLKSVFEIQLELKDILKMHMSMISEQKPAKKQSPQKKKSRK